MTAWQNGFKMDPLKIFGAKMTTLSIKDVPEVWAEALRQRAARNHRSLQGELTAILEAAIHGSSESQRGTHGPGAGLAPVRVTTGMRRGYKTIEQIARGE